MSSIELHSYWKEDHILTYDNDTYDTSTVLVFIRSSKSDFFIQLVLIFFIIIFSFYAIITNITYV